jgi:hypothetical protein
MPQPVATPIHNLMLRSSLRNAGASLETKDGVVIGIVLPTVASTAGTNPLTLLAAMAIIAALVIYSSNNVEIERRYPRTNRVLRHFTRARFGPLIWGSKMIFASLPGGTYNKDFLAVYMADPEDPFDAQARASCPPTPIESAEITKSYDLKLDEGESSQDRARAYVDIELTREDYWRPHMDEVTNINGAKEVVFREPLLYFGQYSVGIEGVGACY